MRTLYWSHVGVGAEANNTITHECIDWTLLSAWVDQRAISAEDRLIRMPDGKKNVFKVGEDDSNSGRANFEWPIASPTSVYTPLVSVMISEIQLSQYLSNRTSHIAPKVPNVGNTV